MINTPSATPATPGDRFSRLAIHAAGGLAGPDEVGPELAGIIWELAQQGNPDRELLEDARAFAVPQYAGDLFAEAILNLIVAAENRADAYAGQGRLMFAARTDEVAQARADADFGHCLTVLRATRAPHQAAA
jgi:hypothetical protein